MIPGTQSPKTYDVFISYNSKDVAAAEKLHEKLDQAGFVVWFDKFRLDPGCNWHQAIEEGCHASRVLLPVLTPLWKTSQWTRYETYGAEAILPVHVAGPLEEVLTPPLSRVQTLSFDPFTAGDEEWSALFDLIRQRLAFPRVEKGDRTAHLRYRPNPNFVGREEDLLSIHEALYRTPTAALTQGKSVAVHALGGVGKTTLAREYAEHYWRLYQQILWVDSRVGFETEYARLAEIFDAKLKEFTDAQEKAAFALRVLNGQTERLLILDNVEDETSVQGWIPTSGGCHTIITSRFAGWSDAIQTLHVYVLEPEPARQFLLKRAGRNATDENIEAADRLAKALGYLPLALVQAAAFIKEEGDEFSFDDYLRLYEQSTRELLAEGVLGSTEYPDSVMTTWRATMARLEQNPTSRAILRITAYFGTEPIPQALFEESFELVQQQAAKFSTEKPMSATGSAELTIRKALKDLVRYSMIERDGHSFAVHALVQTVQRIETPESVKKLWLELALNILVRYAPAAPDDVRTWPIWEKVGPHIAKAVEHADQMRIADPTALLMSGYGGLLQTKCLFTEAELLYRRALAIDEEFFGAEHPNVATQLNNLAMLLRTTNRQAEAEPLLRRALDINEASFGFDHHNVALVLNNMALLLQVTNRFQEAEPLMRRALAIDEASFGAEHTRVAAVLINLAQLLQATNRLEEAEPLIRRALAIDKATFGTEHPRVATDLNNLAQVLKATNRIAEAEPLMRRALAIDEASFGAEHPKVALGLSNLAMLLMTTNRLAEAEPLMRHALDIDEATFGTEHPNVAVDLNNLSLLLDATNRMAEAEPLFRRALAIDKTSFGADHPNVARGLSNLAALLKNTNRLEEAEPLMRQSLAIDEASFGAEHPNVALRLNNLAQLLQAKNRFEEAEPLMRRALAIDQASFGPEHPNVARDLDNLAQVLQHTNRLEEAETLMRRALAIDEASFGAEHPNVAIRLNNLSVLYQDTHRLAEAEPLMRRMVAIFLKFTASTGHQHLHLETAIGNYEGQLQTQGWKNNKIDKELNELSAEYGLSLDDLRK